MKRYTDIFIDRPVLALVVNLLILVLGLRSIALLPIQQYPSLETAVISVMTPYTGANPEVMAGFITAPLENSISQANGIDYLTSSSSLGSSLIKANLRLNYDPIKASSEIISKINAVLNQLPPGAQHPIMNISVGNTIDDLYMGFYSQILSNGNITDYLLRLVQPKLQAIPGVQTAEILGGEPFALRVWLDPLKLAAYNLTAADVAQAISKNNFIAAVGRTNGEMVVNNLSLSSGLESVEGFKQLIVKSNNNSVVHLGDIAKIELGSQNYDSRVSFDNTPSVYIGIKVAPGANLLTVIEAVKKSFPEIHDQLPQGLEGKIVYDSTAYVNNSIHDVIKSLIEALLIVTAVIFLFLATLRSVIIAVIAIPLSLIGAFFVMFLLGFSINLLTLLALVLAIGLVVDDAIIVIENVYRYMETGLSPTEAALQGARDLANPILAMTAVLIAVFVPIGFMGGLTGALFTEFAFTLAAAVTISAIVALTLSPMMCSKILKPLSSNKENTFAQKVDFYFEKLKIYYEKSLHFCLNDLSLPLVFSGFILLSIYFLYAFSKSELAPQEDQGIILMQTTAAPNASLAQTQVYSSEIYHLFSGVSFVEHIFQIDGSGGLNTSIAGVVFKPWKERTLTTMAIQPKIQEKLKDIAGASSVAFQPSPLPGGGGGLPLQVVIQTTQNFAQLNKITQELLAEIKKTDKFVYTDTDLKIDVPQTEVEINRDKAAEFGLSMQDIGQVLTSSLSEGYVNYFNYFGRSYQVIPQVIGSERLNVDQLKNYYINTPKNGAIPLTTLITLKNKVVPESLNHFQQLNSATIIGVPAPGVALGDALATVQKLAKSILPTGYSLDYAGQSRQFMQESNALAVTFGFALIIIYLVLAGLFESLRDPLIILISVPMSICGALIFIFLGIGGASLNIYTEVGLVTLIGLISKQGILIVEFANELQAQGKSKREAVEQAAAIRLRPILMTTAAMVLGVFPFLIASGAGAVSRFNIGLVITTGLTLGTFFTLYVVPAMYLWLASAVKVGNDHS